MAAIEKVHREPRTVHNGKIRKRGDTLPPSVSRPQACQSAGHAGSKPAWTRRQCRCRRLRRVVHHAADGRFRPAPQRSARCGKVVQKLGRHIPTGHQKSVPCPGKSDVEQASLRGIDLVEIGLVGDRLDAGLERDDFVVARRDGDGGESQPLAKCMVTTAT